MPTSIRAGCPKSRRRELDQLHGSSRARWRKVVTTRITRQDRRRLIRSTAETGEFLAGRNSTISRKTLISHIDCARRAILPRTQRSHFTGLDRTFEVLVFVPDAGRAERTWEARAAVQPTHQHACTSRCRNSCARMSVRPRPLEVHVSGSLTAVWSRAATDELYALAGRHQTGCPGKDLLGAVHAVSA